MTHYLESLDKDNIIYKFDKFDADIIKQCIINYFKNTHNQKDELWFFKVDSNNKTVGDDYIDAFVFRNGEVCKEIQKGNRTFYKRLN